VGESVRECRRVTEKVRGAGEGYHASEERGHASCACLRFGVTIPLCTPDPIKHECRGEQGSSFAIDGIAGLWRFVQLRTTSMTTKANDGCGKGNWHVVTKSVVRTIWGCATHSLSSMYRTFHQGS
jgi:hypothetical protein